MEPTRIGPSSGPLSAERPPWRAQWTQWGDSQEPVLLLAAPSRHFDGEGLPADDQFDAWYCLDGLRMARWGGGSVMIPALRYITVHVGTRDLLISVLGRPWLQPALQDAGREEEWSAVRNRHTLLGVHFVGPRPTEMQLTFGEYFAALRGGRALVADVPVLTSDADPERPQQ